MRRKTEAIETSAIDTECRNKKCHQNMSMFEMAPGVEIKGKGPAAALPGVPRISTLMRNLIQVKLCDK
ncbi:hypothetical protein GCM10027456_61490 [Kineosporia babensis]